MQNKIGSTLFEGLPAKHRQTSTLTFSKLHADKQGSEKAEALLLDQHVSACGFVDDPDHSLVQVINLSLLVTTYWLCFPLRVPHWPSYVSWGK